MVSYVVLLDKSRIDCLVLILIVVEDGLVPVSFTMKQFIHFSLNPCCNGRWSRTYDTYDDELKHCVS